uniref:DUF7789 domain-containing protein n=1 Tax=Oncorhynchus tshawytscha TaxID=74940 RepID=A0A8C8DAG0_ONCTS
QELIPPPCGPSRENKCNPRLRSSPMSTLLCDRLLSVPPVFCIYYITRGILQENRQELIVFVLSVLMVMMRSVVNFMVLPVQFVCILCVVVVAHVLCATLLIQRPKMMVCRVGGALETIQEQYFLLNLCSSMVTFELQAQLCLCILIMMSGTTMSLTNRIILGFGVVWACLTAVVGGYRSDTHWGQDKTYTLETAAVTGAVISVLIKGVLFWALFRLAIAYFSFTCSIACLRGVTGSPGYSG